MRKLFYLIMALLLAACNGNKSNKNSTKEPLNIIVAIDFDYSRIKNKSLINRDTVIMNYIFDYFFENQRSKQFKSNDKIIIGSFNETENNNTFLLEMNKLKGENGGYYGLQDRIDVIKNNIITEYKKNQSQQVKSNFYRFFKDELANYIENGSRNKLIIISNGTSIIKDEVPKDIYGTFIQKSEYLRVLNNNNWENMVKEIDLSPVYEKCFENLDVLMPDLFSFEPDSYPSESRLLKVIWENWFTKSGFNHSVKLASNLNSYEKIIKNFLEQEKKQTGDIVTKKNRDLEYVRFMNLDNKELVQDNIGNYYLVDIQSTKTKHSIAFKSGEYIINSFMEEFNKPMLEFRASIIDIIKSSGVSKNNFKIYVKGSADKTGNLTFRRHINQEYPYREITYFKKINNSEYRYTTNEIGTTQIEDNIYNNSKLPNLRAKFIKEVFQKEYQMNDYFGETGILDGSISQDTTFKGRNVQIFLYYKP